MRYKRKIKRTIKKIDIIFSLLILLTILKHIDVILDIFIGLVILSGLGFLFYKSIKYLYYHLRWKDSEYGYFDIVRKVRNMNPREFEVFCANLLGKMNEYTSAKATEPTCDGGKDVIAIDNRNDKVYVECKHYREGNTVGRPMIQKLIGACAGEGVHKAIFITTSSYSNEAIEYAKKINWLEMWTMKDIVKAVDRIDKKKVGYVLNCVEG